MTRQIILFAKGTRRAFVTLLFPLSALLACLKHVNKTLPEHRDAWRTNLSSTHLFALGAIADSCCRSKVRRVVHLARWVLLVVIYGCHLMGVGLRMLWRGKTMVGDAIDRRVPVMSMLHRM